MPRTSRLSTPFLSPVLVSRNLRSSLMSRCLVLPSTHTADSISNSIHSVQSAAHRQPPRASRVRGAGASPSDQASGTSAIHTRTQRVSRCAPRCAVPRRDVACACVHVCVPPAVRARTRVSGLRREREERAAHTCSYQCGGWNALATWSFKRGKNACVFLVIRNIMSREFRHDACALPGHTLVLGLVQKTYVESRDFGSRVCGRGARGRRAPREVRGAAGVAAGRAGWRAAE